VIGVNEKFVWQTFHRNQFETRTRVEVRRAEGELVDQVFDHPEVFEFVESVRTEAAIV
jgi:hypothetical protein